MYLCKSKWSKTTDLIKKIKKKKKKKKKKLQKKKKKKKKKKKTTARKQIKVLKFLHKPLGGFSPELESS